MINIINKILQLGFVYKTWTLYCVQIPGVFPSAWGFFEDYYDGPIYWYSLGPFCTISSVPWSPLDSKQLEEEKNEKNKSTHQPG